MGRPLVPWPFPMIIETDPANPPSRASCIASAHTAINAPSVQHTRSAIFSAQNTLRTWFVSRAPSGWPLSSPSPSSVRTESLSPSDGYWQKVREICDKYEILLICDEVMTGFGRTGKWFAIEHWHTVPDVITTAKGITGGYVPLAATSMRQWVAEEFEGKQWVHGHTYSGHTLAMAAGVAAIDIYMADGLVQRSAELGQYLMEKALELQEKHPSVGDVRGKGLFVGLELVKDRRTKEPIRDPWMEGPRQPTPKMKVLAKALQEGMYCLPGQTSVIILAPPLTITKGEIDYAMGVFDTVLDIADEEVAI